MSAIPTVLTCRLIKTTRRLTFDIVYQDPKTIWMGDDDGDYYRFVASNGYEVISRSRMDIQTERLWREQDATKNSVSMLAQHHFSHKELHGKNTAVKIDMLKTQRDVIWEDCPEFFKHGSYVKRQSRTVVNPKYPDQPAVRHFIEVIPGNLASMPSSTDRTAFVIAKEWPEFVEQMGT